jgi:hypothetical protein
MKSLNFDKSDISYMHDLFVDTIELVYEVYGDLIFRPYNTAKKNWSDKPLKAYYDSKMIGFSRHLKHKEKILEMKEEIIDATKKLFENDSDNLLSGGIKSKTDIQKSVNLFSNMLSNLL